MGKNLENKNLFKMTVEWNSLEDRLSIICKDLGVYKTCEVKELFCIMVDFDKRAKELGIKLDWDMEYERDLKYKATLK